jgi:hypothetical protein
VYRRFGEVDAAETSPLYERVAVALSESDEALRAIEAAPARKRHPTVILAALHDLALAGRAPALAAAYAAADCDAAAGGVQVGCTAAEFADADLAGRGVGEMRVERILTVVVLPAPFGPSREKIVPSGRARSTPSSTTLSP